MRTVTHNDTPNESTSRRVDTIGRLINSSPFTVEQCWQRWFNSPRNHLSVLNKHQSYIKTHLNSRGLFLLFGVEKDRFTFQFCSLQSEKTGPMWSCSIRNIPTRKSNYSSNWLTDCVCGIMCAYLVPTACARKRERYTIAIGKYGRMKTHD